MDKDRLRLKLKGAVYGHMVGEAVAIQRRTKTEKLFYGDDSALCCCIMLSLRERETIDFDDMVQRMQDWYVTGLMAGNKEEVEAGPLMVRAMRSMINGVPPERCGIATKEDETSESLGRTLPIALFCVKESIDESVEFAHRASSLTNAQINSQICCALFSLLIRNIVLEKEEKITELLADYYTVKKLDVHREALAKIRKAHKVIRTRLKDLPEGDSDPVIAFWLAWDACTYHESDFVGCLNAVISEAKGSPTAAAIAGAILGLNLGYNDIPRKLLRCLVVPPEATAAVDDFIAMTAAFAPATKLEA
jgi:ADP-ribosylglycohydrolase